MLKSTHHSLFLFSLFILCLCFFFFAELMQASRGAVKVTIISAEALKKKQLETIQSGIVAMVGAGKTVSPLLNN